MSLLDRPCVWSAVWLTDQTSPSRGGLTSAPAIGERGIVAIGKTICPTSSHLYSSSFAISGHRDLPTMFGNDLLFCTHAGRLGAVRLRPMVSRWWRWMGGDHEKYCGQALVNGALAFRLARLILRGILFPSTLESSCQISISVAVAVFCSIEMVLPIWRLACW